jgi:hypothetical protein
MWFVLERVFVSNRWSSTKLAIAEVDWCIASLWQVVQFYLVCTSIFMVTSKIIRLIRWIYDGDHENGFWWCDTNTFFQQWKKVSQHSLQVWSSGTPLWLLWRNFNRVRWWWKLDIHGCILFEKIKIGMWSIMWFVFSFCTSDAKC